MSSVGEEEKKKRSLVGRKMYAAGRGRIAAGQEEGEGIPSAKKKKIAGEEEDVFPGKRKNSSWLGGRRRCFVSKEE